MFILSWCYIREDFSLALGVHNALFFVLLWLSLMMPAYGIYLLIKLFSKKGKLTFDVSAIALMGAILGTASVIAAVLLFVYKAKVKTEIEDYYGDRLLELALLVENVRLHKCHYIEDAEKRIDCEEGVGSATVVSIFKTYANGLLNIWVVACFLILLVCGLFVLAAYKMGKKVWKRKGGRGRWICRVLNVLG